MPQFSPFRVLTRGFGGPATAILLFSFSMKDVVETIRESVKGDGNPLEFDDGIEIYKISTILQEINNTPLDNPLYNKITKMIIEKKIKINADLVTLVSRNSEPYRIVIGEHRVIREPNE